jgi:hypothetical protein
MTPNPQAEILSYFQNLLESNKLSFFKNEAITKIQELYGSQVEFVDPKKGIIKYEKVFYDQATDGPIEAIVTYNFAQEFPKEVFKEVQIAKEKIDAIVFDINKAGNNAQEFLNTQAKLLRSLIEKSKVVYPKLKFIETNLLELLTYLIDKYSLSESFKKQAQINLPKTSFFNIKPETRVPILKQIYEVAIELGIFDYEEVTIETFINVLCGDPMNTTDFLKFSCDNELAVHFIYSLQPLFFDFTVSKIDKSQSFFNKQRKLLNQADLDNAHTRIKKKNSAKIKRLDRHLSKILKS